MKVITATEAQARARAAVQAMTAARATTKHERALVDALVKAIKEQAKEGLAVGIASHLSYAYGQAFDGRLAELPMHHPIDLKPALEQHLRECGAPRDVAALSSSESMALVLALRKVSSELSTALGTGVVARLDWEPSGPQGLPRVRAIIKVTDQHPVLAHLKASGDGSASTVDPPGPRAIELATKITDAFNKSLNEALARLTRALENSADPKGELAAQRSLQVVFTTVTAFSSDPQRYVQEVMDFASAVALARRQLEAAGYALRSPCTGVNKAEGTVQLVVDVPLAA